MQVRLHSGGPARLNRPCCGDGGAAESGSHGPHACLPRHLRPCTLPPCRLLALPDEPRLELAGPRALDGRDLAASPELKHATRSLV